MLIIVIAIALLVLWLTGFFGAPVIPEIALPMLTISWSDPIVKAVVIILLIVLAVILLRR
jgi:hypothetical protein